MQRRLSRKRPLFSIAVEIQQLTLSIPSSASMSIYAFDQLLFSITGKPALTSANKKREFLLDAHHLLTTSSNTAQQQTQEHTIRIAQRFPFQGSLRPRFHGPNGLKPQVLSMHLYGLKRSGWPKTLLASFTVNVIEHMEALQVLGKRESGDPERRLTQAKAGAPMITVAASGGLYSGSNLQLSLDGLLLHKSKDVIAPEGDDQMQRLPSRFQWGRFSLPSTPFQTKPNLSLPATTEPEPSSSTPTRRLFRRNSLLPLERQIELVGWRRRRRTSRSQSTSPSHYGEKVRRASSYEPRECNERMSEIELSSEDEDEDEDEDDSALDLQAVVDTPEYTAPEYTEGEQWRQHAEAEQANASLASELMTRRLSRTPAEWAQAAVRTGVDAASHYIEFRNAHHSHSDDTLSDEYEARPPLYAHGGVVHEDETTVALRNEVETLRTEHADQRELIRRLLIENKRLMLEAEGCPACHSTQLEPEAQSRNQTTLKEETSLQQPPRRRPMSIPASKAHNHPPKRSRLPSLTFTVVDGQEMLIDPHFDDIVQQMESDFEKLLGTSASYASPAKPPASSSQRTTFNRSIGKRF